MYKFKRNVTNRLLESLKESPAVLIAGARQTGKTTLVHEIGKNLGLAYATFDDLFAQGAAEADPIGFINNIKKPAILDEVQRAPKIFLPIKKDIDENLEPGRFLLTGSANPLVIPELADSLAGRMQIIHLWPLSQGEILGHQETFIDNIFSVEIPEFVGDKISREELIDKLVKGGYPALQKSESERARYNWCNGYLTTLIQKDITDLAKVENLRSIPNILQTLATRAGSMLNERDIARNIAIPVTTLHRHLQLLQHLFLISFVPGWYRNLGKRLVKSPKIYFSDTAILLHLLGFNEERLLSNTSMLGHIVENFITLELIKQLTWSKTIARLYHYRSHDGAEEVDLVLENTSGKIVGIEVKNTETITVHDFKGLKKLQEDSEEGFHRGYVLYPGDKQYSFGKNLYAVPMSSIWS